MLYLVSNTRLQSYSFTVAIDYLWPLFPLLNLIFFPSFYFPEDRGGAGGGFS